VPIIKSKRQRRKELAYFRSARCVEHHAKSCDNTRCQFDIRQKFYGRRKKKMPPAPSGSGADDLFRVLQASAASIAPNAGGF
jgi:hypothetical protein